jgi:hypothetical protein
LSFWHLDGGGLNWLVGTVNFGCHTLEGYFCPEIIKKNAPKVNDKMTQIKHVQGAKSSHEGILPSAKNT